MLSHEFTHEVTGYLLRGAHILRWLVTNKACLVRKMPLVHHVLPFLVLVHECTMFTHSLFKFGVVGFVGVAVTSDDLHDIMSVSNHSGALDISLDAADNVLYGRLFAYFNRRRHVIAANRINPLTPIGKVHEESARTVCVDYEVVNGCGILAFNLLQRLAVADFVPFGFTLKALAENILEKFTCLADGRFVKLALRIAVGFPKNPRTLFLFRGELTANVGADFTRESGKCAVAVQHKTAGKACKTPLTRRKAVSTVDGVNHLLYLIARFAYLLSLFRVSVHFGAVDEICFLVKVAFKFNASLLNGIGLNGCPSVRSFS